jgi:outer membrane cobalamin receptor
MIAPDVPPLALRAAPGDSVGPLIIVDDKVQPGGASLDQLRMNDIESIEIIKRVDDSARYGAEARGVIIIITKTAEQATRSPSR